MKFPKGTKRNNSSPCPNSGESGIRRIIGVDPGLASTGWGIVEYRHGRPAYIAHGCIATPASQSRPERLYRIYSLFKQILVSYGPTEGAVETLYFAKNISSALPVAEARGVLCMALCERGLPVKEFTPMAIKQAVVGRGAADKAQVQELVRLILGMESVPKPEHAADALAAALCAAQTAVLAPECMSGL